MAERYLLKVLAKARGSKSGALLVTLGVLILFAYLLFGLVSIAGDVAFVVTGAGPVIEFLGTGPGVLVAVSIATLMALLGAAFMISAAPQPGLTKESGGIILQSAPAGTDAHQAQEAKIERLTAKLSEVERERDLLRTMSPEEFQVRQDHRRKRIEEWRSAIRAPDFDAKKFTNTPMYSEMRAHLQPEVRNILEVPWAAILKLASPPRKQGQSGDKHMLLDEVARIEKEWGLV